MDREQRIYNEKVRLASIFWKLPREEFFGLIGLIDQASFLRITLDDLQEEIANSGTTDDYQNGNNQSGKKISASLQSYNQTAKLYEKIIATLMKYVPINKDYHPPGADDHEVVAYKNFQIRNEVDFYLSDEFRDKLATDKAKALNLMIQGK